MKVSLCVSGKWTDVDFTERMREIIPHDNYYTMTYTDCDHDSTFKMDEPEVTYHPVLDTEPYGDGESLERRYFFTVPDEDIKRGDFHNSLLDFKRKAVHWNKQILIHNHMLITFVSNSRIFLFSHVVFHSMNIIIHHLN